MKTFSKTLAVISISALLTACGGGASSSSEGQASPAPEKADHCDFAYDNSKTLVSWTAYKTTAKVGVGGEFKSFKITPSNGHHHTMKELVVGSTFEIDPSSTFTKDAGRDKKIVEHFFGKMIDQKISGKVNAMNGDLNQGTISFDLTMNGQTKPVEAKFSVKDNELIIDGEIDVLNWSANDALAALNEACKDLHKGEDGVSKTWSTVGIHLSTYIDVDCHH